ncbi:MAG: hypothetical protein ACI8ZB_002934 [Desulforhopalus sp.]|jgi:hypothetical protein
MEYIIGYLSLGMVLAVIKSPIRKLVDWEVADLKMHCLIKKDDIHAAKLFLFRLVLSFIIVAIYPIILFRKLEKIFKDLKLNTAIYLEPIESEPAWLGDEISKENAEAINMVTVDKRTVPFGYNNSRWLNIVKIMEEGDRLYEFRSPEESWKSYEGLEGIALVRNGIIVADLVILLN